jgi:hypothetical protein
VLRRVFGPKRDETTGGWRKLRNKELHNLHTSPITKQNEPVEEDEMDRACVTRGENRNACRILVGESEEK